jgi:hypothetical protein
VEVFHYPFPTEYYFLQYKDLLLARRIKQTLREFLTTSYKNRYLEDGKKMGQQQSKQKLSRYRPEQAHGDPLGQGPGFS